MSEVVSEERAGALQRLAKMFAALSAVNEAILRTNSEQQLYQQVCDAARGGGDLIGAAVLLREEGTDRLRFVAGNGESIERLRDAQISVAEGSPHGQGLAGTAFRSARPCISNDFLSDIRASAWREELRAAGVRAAAALPLMRAGASVGVLVVYMAEVGALDAEIVSLLIRMADNVSFALDNLDREARRKASERVTRRLQRMYAALSATNEAILRSKAPQELYERVCDAAVHGGKSIATTVLLAQPGSPWLEPVAGTKIVGRFSIDPDNPYGKGVCGQAFRDKKPAVNPDLLNSEQARPWREANAVADAVACAAMPLVKRGRSIGVLMFFLGRSWALDQEVVGLLARMAENISFALDNFDREDERQRAEVRARHLATHDNLTDLPNRAMFSQTLDDAIKAARHRNAKFTIMFVDLDRFKLINDTLGHGAGDILLREVAARIKGCLGNCDVLARFGGDEFVILLHEVSDAAQVGAVARRLLSAAVAPILIHGRECRVTASIGIATFPDDGSDEQSLTKNADAAMYLAKEEGRNGFKFFCKEMKTQSIERLMLENSLRRALERGEFLLHYQAKQDLETGDISGVEALLRWQHPDLGILPPLQFIPLAEESGLIIPIGRWVLETACAQNVAWQRQGLPPMPMAINLSPRQFNDHLIEDIRQALRNSGMAPELLELEITESMVMQNVGQATSLLGAIRAMGIRLSIDDFGTGYSSMSLIKQFPIDTIKVDRSFVREIPSDPNDRAITEAIIALGKALDLTIVAEGVETKEQEQFLHEQHCDEIQGFLFTKPLCSDDFVAFVRAHNISQLKVRTTNGRRRSPRKSAQEPRRRKG